MPRLPRPYQRGRYGRVRHGPGHGQPHHGHAHFGGLGPQSIDCPKIAVVEVDVGVGRHDIEAGALRYVPAVRRVLAREEAGAHRAERRDRDLLLDAQGKQFLLVVAQPKVVAGLGNLVAGKAAGGARLQGFPELRCAVLAAAYDLGASRLHLIRQRTQGLVYRHVRVGPVELVYVDVIGSQPLEAVGEGAVDVLGGPARAEFRHQDHVVPHAPLLHPPANDVLGGAHLSGDLALVVDAHRLQPRALRLAPSVCLRRVEEGQAPLHRIVHHAVRVVLADLTAERDTAQRDGWDGPARPS